jgi:ATP-dependent Lon protease
MDNFSFSRIHIPDEFHRRFERLLEGGIWAIVDVEYRPTEDNGKGSPFHISDLKPIQLARFDFEDYCAGRSTFTTDEWIDLLLRSTGLEPTRFERRLKLLLLSRFKQQRKGNRNGSPLCSTISTSIFFAIASTLSSVRLRGG